MIRSASPTAAPTSRSTVRGESARSILGAKLLALPAMKAVQPLLDGVHSAFEAVREARHPQAHAALWLMDACGALVYREARGGQADAPRASGPEIEVVVAKSAERAADVSAAGAAA